MITNADDTIAAIATPPGPAGIGIIRLSGCLALPILKKLFISRHGVRDFFDDHRMYHGWIVNPDNGDLVDEVMAVFMLAPHSYTREDVVEIQGHGNFLVLQKMLALTLKQGARLAGPGEFTKRAFLNGRIDLTQAEAVLEVLQAKTGDGLKMAMAQLYGRLHDTLKNVRETLLEVLALIEVAIDFPEDDVEILNTEELVQTLEQKVRGPLEELIAACEKGKVYREGIAVVISGRPNVGKSSLLNRLLQEERAIVTPVPGTTRDTIEEYINIKGMPVRIVDTAGIREVRASVEELGIQRARQKLEEADLVLFLVDASEQPGKEDQRLYEDIKGRPHILVLNKIDIALAKGFDLYSDKFPAGVIIKTSTKTGEGMSDLEEAVFNAVAGGSTGWDPGKASVPNLRHRESLFGAAEAVSLAIAGLECGAPPDLVAVDLQAVSGHLADIVGETTPEDVLEIIFERFCIGK